MKALLITVSVIALSAIIGNPVCWYLSTHTEYQNVAQWLGMISAYTFLGGIVFLFAIGVYYSSQNRS